MTAIKRIKELGKDVLIVILSLSILFLTLLALPSSTVRKLPLPAALADLLGVTPVSAPSALSSGKLTQAAKPLMISVSHSGSRCTMRRSSAALEEGCQLFYPFFTQALATAGSGRTITPEQFQTALEGDSLLLSFGGSFPAQVVSQWLTGTDGQIAVSTGDYLLYVQENKVVLMTGEMPQMQYDTGVSPAKLLDTMQRCTPDGSRFAPEQSGMSPLMLWETEVRLPLLSVEASLSPEDATDLATELGFNPYGAGTYTDLDGNTIFSESDRSLSVSPAGQVLLQNSQPGLQLLTAPDMTPSALVETARQLLTRITDGALGEARLQLRSFTASDSKSVCVFGYVVGETPIYPASARVVFQDSTVQELTIDVCRYLATNQSLRLMPPAAAAAVSKEGARLIPAYDRNGRPGWTIL